MKSKGKKEGEREGAHRGVGNEGKHNPWSIEHGSPFDTFGYFPQPVNIVGRSRFFCAANEVGAKNVGITPTLLQLRYSCTTSFLQK